MAEKNFKKLEDLKPVVAIVNEAEALLEDKNRTITNSPMSDVLAGALGAGAGGAASFAALWGLGTVGLSAAGITSALATAGALVGGGMVAGVFVLAAPIAALAAAGVGISAAVRNNKLENEKKRLYTAAVEKQNAIIKALNNEKNADKARIDALTAVNIYLQKAINDLKSDLGEAA